MYFVVHALERLAMRGMWGVKAWMGVIAGSIAAGEGQDDHQQQQEVREQDGDGAGTGSEGEPDGSGAARGPLAGKCRSVRRCMWRQAGTQAWSTRCSRCIY